MSKETPIAKVYKHDELEKYVIQCECHTHYLEINYDFSDGEEFAFLEMTDEYHPGHWILGDYISKWDLVNPAWWWRHHKSPNTWSERRDIVKGSRVWTIWQILRGRPIYFSGVMLNREAAIKLGNFLRFNAQYREPEPSK